MAADQPTLKPQNFASIGVRHYQVIESASNTETDRSTPIFMAPSDGVVHSVSFTVGAAVAGHATNTRSIVLVNGGTAGTGSTALATRKLLTTAALAAGEQIVLYEPSTPLAVSRGNLLLCDNQEEGTGIVVPMIFWNIQFEGRN